MSPASFLSNILWLKVNSSNPVLNEITNLTWLYCSSVVITRLIPIFQTALFLLSFMASMKMIASSPINSAILSIVATIDSKFCPELSPSKFWIICFSMLSSEIKVCPKSNNVGRPFSIILFAAVAINCVFPVPISPVIIATLLLSIVLSILENEIHEDTDSILSISNSSFLRFLYSGFS